MRFQTFKSFRILRSCFKVFVIQKSRSITNRISRELVKLPPTPFEDLKELFWVRSHIFEPGLDDKNGSRTSTSLL